MAHKGRIRVCTPSPEKLGRSLHLVQSVTILYISPTKTPQLLDTQYNYTHATLALPTLLDSNFRSTNANVIACTSTPITRANSAMLLPQHLRLSLDAETFSALGLTAQRSLQAAQRTKIAARNRTVVQIGLDESKLIERAKWALSEERVGRADIYLTRGTAAVTLPDDVTATTSRVVCERHEWSVPIDDIPDVERVQQKKYDADLHGILEAIQLLAYHDRLDRPETNTKAMKKVKVVAHRYIGVCNSDLVRECVQCAREMVADGHVLSAIVLSKGLDCAPMVWNGGGGKDRGGCMAGFDGDAAEVCVISKNGAVSIELRGPSDVV